jgi:hypothetical protein
VRDHAHRLNCEGVLVLDLVYLLGVTAALAAVSLLGKAVEKL